MQFFLVCGFDLKDAKCIHNAQNLIEECNIKYDQNLSYKYTNRMRDNDGYLPLPKSFATTAIHTGAGPPISEWTTYEQLSFQQVLQTQNQENPSRHILEQCLAKLEGGKYALCFSSSVWVVEALLDMCKSGDHVICVNDLYIRTFELLNNISASMGIIVSFIDATEIANVEKAVKPTTKLIWIETITNPMLRVLDIEAISEVAKKHNIVMVVDSTFLTPYFHRPLEFGADLVLHSLTNYICGHGDVIMGAIILKDVKIYERLHFLRMKAMGNVPLPISCFQVTRSLQTLSVRMKQHSHNALTIATFLETHPKVVRVIHPGLPNHPQHELFKRQTSCHSGMLSFYINGGSEQSQQILNNLKIFTISLAVGGCESVANIPFLMTHAMIAEEQRKSLNITGNMIALSIGLEDVEDLVEDLQQALITI